MKLGDHQKKIINFVGVRGSILFKDLIEIFPFAFEDLGKRKILNDRIANLAKKDILQKDKVPSSKKPMYRYSLKGEGKELYRKLKENIDTRTSTYH